MAKKKVIIKDNESYILPSDNKELTSFITKYKVDMMDQVVSSIEYALENKLPIIEVFQFKNSHFVITITEKEFESNLDNIYNCYMQDEVYELCPRVVKLRELLKRKTSVNKEGKKVV